ncbi:hypothetical protein N7466_006356 [Penicillium verhagenii]|uniref:uncharacterized protein n=1 Tax=Penicillium verhagenii TaxID=1562060 RepID=UPI002544E162|nr:uncharacterized protein N7466_006356 [Penicillium verhagenii]KAJ5930863.1 hypothetical protein N7466_006356 [Penicillium verhagenii]
MQDLQAVAVEAERWVKELGFVSVLINGYTQSGDAETVQHLDEPYLSGLFDTHPKLKVLLGHCGEGLTLSLAGIDHRMRHFKPENFKCKLRMQRFWEKEFWITTADVASGKLFFDTLRSCGKDRFMWDVDYPYEDYGEVSTWYERLELSENSRTSKIE